MLDKLSFLAAICWARAGKSIAIHIQQLSQSHNLFFVPEIKTNMN